MLGCPAAVVWDTTEVGLDALWTLLREPRTNICTLLVLLVPGDEVQVRVHDERPVDGIQVTELRVLLDPYGAAGDVAQAVEADVFQVVHLEDDQRVVVEEIATSDHRQVREERAQGFQAGDAEEEQVVRNHGQLGETKRAEDLLIGVLVYDEKDLQVALNHRTVLQLLEITDVISDVNAWSTDYSKTKKGVSDYIQARDNATFLSTSKCSVHEITANNESDSSCLRAHFHWYTTEFQ